ncbi:kinase D-interacting substrate of 220 kDa isoform X1 [Hydra vulgaris]|uniref:kinase D-interacting substrate of 220 kDa isoform X1 n=1 Tax=Hydra vulgaris TaxID=6087 RepID=UPI001F5EE8D3|nr:kinase D-interacting substrate of 220 kDa isoform X1 [Hydra vulgaris]
MMEENTQDQLFKAVEGGNLSIVLKCISKIENLNQENSNGQTALILSAEKGFVDIVRELLNHDVEVNHRDEDGRTALIEAAKRGSIEIVTLLLDHGAKFITDLGGWTPLVWASYKGNTEVVRQLLLHAANPNERGQYSMTPLIWASGRGHSEVVRVLVQHGAKVEIADKYGTSALIWACRKGHLEVAKILISKGASCDVAGTHRWTPLIMASKGGFTEMVVLLLEQKLNVNAIDQDGRTALSWSAVEGYSEIVSKLLENGAQVNIPDKNGLTPLMLAAKEGHTAVIKILLAASAKVDTTDNEKRTALYYAVDQGHLDVATELINNGASCNHRDKDGETLLIRAAKKKHTQCAKVLLANGADSNASDKKGDTPLHIAVQNRHYSMCEVLVKDGHCSEELNFNNKTGEVSIDIARPTNVSCDEKMDQNNVYLTTLADFFVDPSLSVPLSVGLFSKKENGKSPYAQKIMKLMEQYREHENISSFLLTMSVVIFIVMTATTIGLFVWISFTWIDAIATAIVIVILTLALIAFARIALLSFNSYINYVGVLLTNFLNRSLWFLKILYLVPLSNVSGSSVLPVHIITIDLSSNFFSSNSPITALVNMTNELTDAIEKDIGMFIPRLYRIFQASPNTLQSNNSLRWKKSCCCIPSIVITLGVLFCLWVSIILYGVFGIHGTSAIVAIQIACCCVLICALLVYILRFILIVYCLVLSTKKRIRIMSNQPNIQEETFVSVLKQEIDLNSDMILSIDGFARRQTRIILNVDFHETLEQDKVLHLINLLNILLCDAKQSFIIVISADPALLTKAANQIYENLGDSQKVAYDFLKSLFNLPYFILEPLKMKMNGIIPPEYQKEIGMISSDNQEELEWDLNDGFQISNELLNRSISSRDDRPISEREDTRLLSNRSPKLSIKEISPCKSDEHSVSLENIHDLSYLFRNDEFGSVADIKRIMNIVSLNGRILRNAHVPFQWTQLAIWVSLCDQWPCKSTWITILCLDGELNIPERMKVSQVNKLYGYGIPTISSTFLGNDSDNSSFDSFISSHKPSINVEDVRIFAPFMIYMDPAIRNAIVEYLIANRSRSPKVCSRSSTFSASKSIANSDHQLLYMTVKDIAYQLAEIDGMDDSLVPIYKNRILENNINGRVLATCDLNELRDVMQMKFGDWQLFKVWIMQNFQKNHSLVMRFPGNYNAFSEDNSFIDETPRFKLEHQESFTKGNVFNNFEPVTSNFQPVKNMKWNAPNCYKMSPSNSPRFRKQFKRMIVNEEITPKDTDTHAAFMGVENGWSLSADSGFASTDVDHNMKLALRKNSLPERKNNKTIENPQRSVDCPDTAKNLEFGNRLSPEFANLSPERLENSLTKDSCQYKLNKSDKVDQVSFGVNKDRVTYKSSLRPISLSEVPLPPAYMLDQSDIWPVDPPSEFIDDIDMSYSSSPSIGVDRKMVLKYAAKYQSMSTHISSSTDTEDHIIMCEKNNEHLC